MTFLGRGNMDGLAEAQVHASASSSMFPLPGRPEYVPLQSCDVLSGAEALSNDSTHP